MAFGIEEFKATLWSGLQKPSKYKVSIHFLRLNYFISENLSLLCESAVLPSRSFRTESEFMFGVARKMPLHAVYDDLSLTFICTGNMTERKFFDKWQSYICNPTSNFMHYYDDYKANMSIATFNDTYENTYTIQIEEAYPISVNVQPLSYGDTDSYLKLTVDFAYKKWRNAQEVLEGDALNQGHSFPSHITPATSSVTVSDGWKAPDQLSNQRDDITINPFAGLFGSEPTGNPNAVSSGGIVPGIDLSNSADVVTGLGQGELPDPTGNNIPVITIYNSYEAPEDPNL